MRIKVWSTQSERQALFEWHRWFAWHPVVIDGSVVWLERIERQRYSDWNTCFWKYRWTPIDTSTTGICKKPGSPS